MLRRGLGERRRGERRLSRPPRSPRSLPRSPPRSPPRSLRSNRHEAEGGVRAHWEELVYLVASTGAAQAQRCFAYLDLQEIVAAHALVVHVMVGLVGIAAILVLDKGKAGECVRQEHHLEDGRAILQPAAGRSRRGDVAAHEPSKAIAKSQQSECPQTKPWAARRVFFISNGAQPLCATIGRLLAQDDVSSPTARSREWEGGTRARSGGGRRAHQRKREGCERGAATTRATATTRGVDKDGGRSEGGGGPATGRWDEGGGRRRVGTRSRTGLEAEADRRGHRRGC